MGFLDNQEFWRIPLLSEHLKNSWRSQESVGNVWFNHSDCELCSTWSFCPILLLFLPCQLGHTVDLPYSILRTGCWINVQESVLSQMTLSQKNPLKGQIHICLGPHIPPGPAPHLGGIKTFIPHRRLFLPFATGFSSHSHGNRSFCPHCICPQECPVPPPGKH